MEWTRDAPDVSDEPRIDAGRVIDGDLDELYQLAADMGGAGFTYVGHNDAAILHDSAMINLNVAEESSRKGVGRILFASSACVYPGRNKLDLEFRFVWPRNTLRGLDEPREIFDDAFLERFEIAESSGLDRKPLPPPTNLSLPEARAFCRTVDQHSVIDVWECFEVLGFAEEPAEAAEARFRAGLGEPGWSGAALELMRAVSRAKDRGGYSAVHIRAGDIVDGDWRPFVPVEKYIPTAFVELAVEILAGPGDGRIVGPRTSAFSRVAAHLGGLTILSAGDLMAGNAARLRLREGIARGSRVAGRRGIVRPLLARDICWYLDVFPEHLAAGEYREMAHRATRCEPDFCGALNRLAAAEAFAGNPRGSREASARALQAATLAEIHADPLVESLATSISARMVIALGAPARRDLRTPEWLGRIPMLRRFGRRVDLAALLEDIEACMERCQALTPFQTHLHDVMLNLRFQRAAMTWTRTADAPSREMVRRAMRPARSAPRLLPSWRPSGYSWLREPAGFSQTVRNLGIATIRIACAIGAEVPMRG